MGDNIKNILIKASGDVFKSDAFKYFATQKAKESFVVIVVGGGTEISKRLEAAGYTIAFDDVHGRITESWEERKIARDVLEENAKKLQDDLVGTGVFVVPSIIDIAGVTCHINGDNYIKSAYLGFDTLYVFTTKERVKAKSKIFKGYPKVNIRAIWKFTIQYWGDTMIQTVLKDDIHRALFNSNNLRMILLINAVFACIFSLLCYFAFVIYSIDVPIIILFIILITFIAGGLISTFVIRVLFEQCLNRELG